MKELEDYVNEKKAHKYLDDLSDIDAENATPMGKDLNKSATDAKPSKKINTSMKD